MPPNPGPSNAVDSTIIADDDSSLLRSSSTANGTEGSGPTVNGRTKRRDKGKAKETAQHSDPSIAPLEDRPMPLLSRPLGVKERPEARLKTWGDTREKFMDTDKRLAERHHLCVTLLLLEGKSNEQAYTARGKQREDISRT